MPENEDEEELRFATFERALDVILNEMDKFPTVNVEAGEEASEEESEKVCELLINSMDDMGAIMQGTMSLEDFKKKTPTYDDEVLN